MPEIQLGGCRAEPIGSYLKALGVLRLVAEQIDPDVSGRWVGDVFAIDANADRDELIDFFLNSYKPTPVFAPWNSAVARGMRIKTDASNGYHELRLSREPRLEVFRQAMQAAERAAQEIDQLSKLELIMLSRNSFPDPAVDWIDSTAVLTSEGAAYPLLTGGTGGNFGRFELTFNFCNNLEEALLGEHTRSREWLEMSLGGWKRRSLVRSGVGQIDPGAAGGINVGESLVNPWDFILAIEGALMFVSGAARRLGFDQRSTAAMPFTVRATAAGHGSIADAEQSKGEVWAPIWRQSATMPEIRQLFSEGRASWAGNQAHSALDFARAAGSLGVDRGIDQFVRHSIGPRLGQSNLATPVGRIKVSERPGVPALAQLDRWFQMVRRMPNPPAAVAACVRNVEKALFAAATSSDPAYYHQLLTAVGYLERALSRSLSAREKVLPISELKSGSWLSTLDDGSLEFRLARSFASLRDEVEGTSALRLYTEPIKRLGRNRLAWTEASAPVEGFGVRPITTVLAECVARRALDAHRASDREESKGPGITVGYSHGDWLPLEDALAYFAGRFDWGAFERILMGLLCLELKPGAPVKSDVGPTPRNPAFSLLAPFGTARTLFHPRLGEVSLKADPRWPAMLLRHRAAEVLDQALLRLRMARLQPAPLSPTALAATVDPQHLATALILPLSNHGVMSLLDDICSAELEES